MNVSYRQKYLAITLGTAVMMAACSDSTTAPSATTGTTARASSNGGQNLIPNSQQYRPQTMPFQSNRSGVASLGTRALQGKDGMTELVATSGKAGVAGAAGNISKLQVKLFSGDNTALSTANFNGLIGSVQTKSFGGLARHSNIQVQANIRDIDPKRTDVVTNTERVNLRPDLAVRSVAAPDKVKPGATFVVTSNVAELNGDVGATSNCVLYLNGAENKRIDGMWVADNDQVTCAFTTSIANPGTYTLSVKAENVSPSDWDLANNSAQTTIEVVNPEVTLHGWAYANHGNYLNESSYRQDYGYRGYWSYTYGQEYRNQQEWQYSYMYGYADQNIALPVSFSFDQTSDGAAAASFAGTSNSYYYGCDYNQDAAGNYVYLCSFGYFQAGHNDGVVTYYDRYFYSYQDIYGYYYSYDYTYYNYSYTYGTRLAPYGSELTSTLRFEDANGTVFKGTVSVPMSESYSYDYGPYDYSSDYDDGFYFSHYTQHYVEHNHQWYGYNSF